MQRRSEIIWVALSDMRVSPPAQREYLPAHAAALALNFDPDAMGILVVNIHDDTIPYLVDGQHRRAAAIMRGYGEQKVQSECYYGLSEAEEAELFLQRNYRRIVRAFDSFRIALTAQRPLETSVKRVVEEQGLRISNDYNEGSVRAVSTLMNIYSKIGEEILAKTLRIIRDAYGTHGFEAVAILGIALACQRYPKLDEHEVIAKLASAHGGVGGLLGKAEALRRQLSQPKTQCIAAAVVRMYNSGATPKNGRLADWWKTSAPRKD